MSETQWKKRSIEIRFYGIIPIVIIKLSNKTRIDKIENKTEGDWGICPVLSSKMRGRFLSSD